MMRVPTQPDKQRTQNPAMSKRMFTVSPPCVAFRPAAGLARPAAAFGKNGELTAFGA